MTYPVLFTVGQVVTASQLNSITTPPGCELSNTAAITCTTAVATHVLFDTEAFDTDNMHSTSSATNLIAPRTSGRYIVVGGGLWAANATGVRQMAIWFNSGAKIAGHDVAARTDGVSQFQEAVMLKTAVGDPFGAGDSFDLVATQSSGGNLALSLQHLAATWLSN